MFCGHSLLTLAYGQRYGAASVALGLACFSAFFNVLNNQITQAFYAKGMPQLHRRSVALMAVVVFVLVYPLAKAFGLWGAQLACLMAMIFGYLLQVERIRKVTGMKISQYLNAFPIPVFTSIAIAVLWVFVTRYTTVMSHPVPSIAVGVGLCLASYLFLGALRFWQAKEVA
jgi:O-antigen/teichoic acid export membrane protein